MNGQQKHEMVLETTHPAGVEEWYCPECGRRLLIRWEPDFKKTVLAAGDEFSIHSGGKGGLRIGTTQVTAVKDPGVKDSPSMSTEDPRLAPWVRWLDEMHWEDYWEED